MFPAFRFPDSPIPDLGRFARHHPLPRSTPKNKDLAVSTPGFNLRIPLDFLMYRITKLSKARSARHTPTRLFPVAYCKQKTLHESTLGPPLRHAWGPLGHAWATQGPPKPNPNRQRVATHPPPTPMSTNDPRSPRTTQGLGGFAKYQEPITKASFAEAYFQRSSTAQPFRSGANLQLYHLFAYGDKKKQGLSSPKKSPRRKNVHPRGGASLRLAVRSNQKTLPCAAGRRAAKRSGQKRPAKAAF